jgi:hypothetical protein
MISALAFVLACSGGKARSPVTDDARHGTVPPPVPTGRDAGATTPAPTGPGDISVRVEWKDVPVAARASPGRTPCDTPRTPQVAPTTTWGVPGAAVIVDGMTKDPGEARVVLAGWSLSPRVVAGSSLVVASAHDRPARSRSRSRRWPRSRTPGRR